MLKFSFFYKPCSILCTVNDLINLCKEQCSYVVLVKGPHLYSLSLSQSLCLDNETSYSNYWLGNTAGFMAL